MTDLIQKLCILIVSGISTLSASGVKHAWRGQEAGELAADSIVVYDDDDDKCTYKTEQVQRHNNIREKLAQNARTRRE